MLTNAGSVVGFVNETWSTSIDLHVIYEASLATFYLRNPLVQPSNRLIQEEAKFEYAKEPTISCII